MMPADKTIIPEPLFLAVMLPSDQNVPVTHWAALRDELFMANAIHNKLNYLSNERCT